MLTRLEIAFEKWRKTIGLFLGPLVFCLLIILPFPSISPSAHKLLAILGLVIIYWITEAIPIPASALLGAVLCVVLGIESDKSVLAPFADPIIFLFIGSFIIAEAMKAHQLDRRFAYWLLSLRLIGDHSYRILFAIGFVSAFISMWISNTATTAMVFPIASGILRALEDIDSSNKASFKRFGTGMMLFIAYAASVGGIATPVGTPPNLIGIGMIERLIGTRISFFQWMTFATPLAAAALVILFILILILHPPEKKRLYGIREYINEKREKLRTWTAGEINSLLAFSVAIILWILPGIFTIFGYHNNILISEGIAALIAALTLFILPTDFKKREFTLTWKQAANIDWGTIILFGGGLTLGGLMFSTKLADSIGGYFMNLTGANSEWAIVALAIFLGIFISETTSNTASANMAIPVVIAIAKSAQVNPIAPALGACIGASFGFMLPISTPPNAIVYSSGRIPIYKMIRTGIVFDILGFFVVLLGLRILYPLLQNNY